MEEERVDKAEYRKFKARLVKLFSRAAPKIMKAAMLKDATNSRKAPAGPGLSQEHWFV